MALTESSMLPLKTEAPSFSLTNVVSGQKEYLEQLQGSLGTLIIFMCNHCPYVVHLMDAIVNTAIDFSKIGVNTIAISSNSIISHPQDGPENMKKLTLEKEFSFPYLFDDTQEVAHAYKAACTPDFYLFDEDLELVYRGRFDDARPKNDNPVTGQDLMEACKKLSEGLAQETNQIPSMGCGIKWKAGNEPKGFSI